jgi:diketogulonate reductase-like aldo/keto reductase
MIAVPQITLNNGVKMPQLGLGVWKASEGPEVEQAVEAALECGYRLIDTASVYGNEIGVGNALKSSGIERSELFVTTKVWNTDQGFDETIRAFETSLNNLQLEYLDLYLIHWPQPGIDKINDTWKAMERLYDEKRVKAIGVSNFRPEDLDALLGPAQIIPAINQIELHPTFNQSDTRKYCIEKGIQVESWSPLMQGPDLFENTIIKEIADIYQKTPAQIILRWHIDSGLIAIPKSVTPDRIKENMAIFDFQLSKEDIERIDGLDSGNRIGPDPKEFVTV